MNKFFIRRTTRRKRTFATNVLLTIMRIFILLITLGLSSAHANSSYGQIKMDIDVKNISIEKLFKEIQNKSDYIFFYKDNIIDENVKISINLKDATLKEILDKSFTNTSLDYSISERQVVIKKTPEPLKIKPTITKQQKFTVSGIITDSMGEPLPGASILEKGTKKGVESDFDGKFTINISSKDAILVVSYLGYATKEISVNDQSNITIVLEENQSELEEIVIIGYGTKKKANLTGATATVKSKDLMVRPVSNASSMLQGRVAGLNIVQNSGQPGDEGVRIRLRGVGSFGNTQPLILIDGIQGDLTAINPLDIKDIVVLKDAASAAIYGSRAANGVILVTTKTGKKNQKTKLEFSTSVGMQTATVLPDFIYDSVEYMEMFNRGAEHTGATQRYPQETIDAYRNAAPGDPRYPNFNWLDHIFKTGSIQNHQMSITGGGESNSFFLNFGIIDQKGIIDRFGSKKYSTRFNFDVDVNESISAGLRNSIVYTERNDPVSDNIYETMLYVYTMPPTMSPYLADGSGRYTARDITGIWRNRNPRMILDSPGYTDRKRYEINPQAYINFHPFKGFSWKTTAGWRFDQRKFERAYATEDGYTFSTNEYFGAFEGVGDGIGVRHSRSGSSTITVNSVINYDFNIDEIHNFNVIGGYEQYSLRHDNIGVYRPEYFSITTPDINAGGTEDQTTSGNSGERSAQSFFGRLSYDYDGKYLFEANARYDADSRLHPDYRWNFFPSASVGWRISEESFMENSDWIDNLKLRASFGELGNANVLSNYPYQNLLSNTQYPINGGLLTGTVPGALPNPLLGWETISQLNFGLDFSMKNGLFGMELDLYKKTTTNGHSGAIIASSIGRGAPTVNDKEMENKGIELILKHTNNIGELTYDMSFTFDAYKNEVTKRDVNRYGTRNSEVVGRPINEYYVLDWIGIYQNQNEVDNLPGVPDNASLTKPGDLLFRDVNGNGEIDTEAAEGSDRVFMSGQHPTFSYSYNLNLNWKNFDMSMFWQGVAGVKGYHSWIGFEPFLQGGPPTTRWRNAWNGEGSTNSLPAMYNLINYSYRPINGQASDFYLDNTSYLRLKNIQLGYTIPNKVCKQIGLQNLRFYASGDNLLTISGFDWDPERTSGSTNSFPQLKTITFGVNLTF